MAASPDAKGGRDLIGFAGWLEKNRLIATDSVEYLEKWMGSGLVAGISPSMAKRLTLAYGILAWETLLRDPLRLSDLPGISSEKALSMHDAACSAAPLHDWIARFRSLELPVRALIRWVGKHPERSCDALWDNPWLLTDEACGLPFADADRLSERIAEEKTDGVRISATRNRLRMEAAVLLALHRGMSDGHTRLDDSMLQAHLSRIFNIDPEVALRQLEEWSSEGIGVDIVRSEDSWALADILVVERRLTNRLLEMSGESGLPVMNATSSWIAGYEMENGLELAHGQKEALRMACRHGVSFVTGGPGTGKTTLIRGLVRLSEDAGLMTLLAAPTGRAAKRMQHATGMEARTIHRLLEVGYDFTDSSRPMFRRNRRNPLECDLLIVDEASMADLFLTAALLDACPPGIRLVMVGDADQLPSVGPGQVLADCLASRMLPAVVLDRVYRQTEESAILRNAWRIHDGLMPEGLVAGHADGENASGKESVDKKVSEDIPLVEWSDFRVVRCFGARQVAASVVSLVRNAIPEYFGFDPLRDIQVLSPMRRGTCGVENLNRMLKEALNPQKSEARHEEHAQGAERYDKPLSMQENTGFDLTVREVMPSGNMVSSNTHETVQEILAVKPNLPIFRGVPDSWNKTPVVRKPASHMGRGSAAFAAGDRVMQNRNDYSMPWTTDASGVAEAEGEGVFNGDTGIVMDVAANGRSLRVLFEDGRIVKYGMEQTDALELAYAITVHKSQGCEYPAVVLPLSGVPDALAFRNLLYTAVTRARRLLVIVGSEDDVARMIYGTAGPTRRTGLAGILKESRKEGTDR